MLTDVKEWLLTAGYPVEEERFLKPPAPPFITFTDQITKRGSDDSNCIAERIIDVELYSDKIDKVAEAAIEALLDAKPVAYSRERIWVQTERFFQTIYSFELTEKTQEV